MNYAPKLGAPKNRQVGQYSLGIYKLLEETGFIKSKTEGKPSRKQAKFIEDFLTAIHLIDINTEIDANNIRSRLNYFLKNLCDTLGYNPNLKGCSSCGKSNNLISFDFESGGFICANCFDHKRHEKLPVEVLKDIHMFIKNDDIYELSELRAQRLFKMYCSFLKDVVGLYLENYEFVLKCL